MTLNLPVFRDQLYKHLETVPEGDFDSFTTKLVQAGSTLEYLKYADALFEILLVGGLLQPGGSYVDDGAPPSPFSILQAKEPAQVDDMKKYVDVLNKLIRRCAPLPFLWPWIYPAVRSLKVQVPPEASPGVRPSGPAPVRQPLVPVSERQVCPCDWSSDVPRPR